MRLGAFGLVLATSLGAGALAGRVAGPIALDADGSHGATGETTATETGDTGLPAGGLQVAQDGYRLRVEDRVLEADRASTLAFTIEGPGGSPVQDYVTVHDRELHLIVVSSDLTHYSHLHPTRDTTGTWRVDLPGQPAGTYRAYADFQPAGGDPLTLGIGLTVPGTSTAPTPLVDDRSSVIDGYQVDVDGELIAGRAAEITITVTRDGQVVRTDPYLGAAGHLVVIRDGDLAYLHVHPLDDRPSGPVRFAVEVPSTGDYALYFDFSHEGVVRSAALAITEVAETPGDDDDLADHGH